ncbi:MAG: hypothetical protein ABEI31_01395 [Halodesulfurarchaeum sp.]
MRIGKEKRRRCGSGGRRGGDVDREGEEEEWVEVVMDAFPDGVMAGGARRTSRSAEGAI